MQIEQIFGKCFRNASGADYGVIRPISGVVPEELAISTGTPIAEDDCGNFFLTFKKAVVFWDHELAQFIRLADSFESFIAGLVDPEPALLRKNQIKSAWIDPEFATPSPLVGEGWGEET
jgi:hypothetical protein